MIDYKWPPDVVIDKANYVASLHRLAQNIYLQKPNCVEITNYSFEFKFYCTAT